MDYTFPFLFLTSGFVVGGAFVWLLLRSKVQHSYERAKAETASERATLIERSRDREAQAHYFCNVVRERDSQIADLRAANGNLRAKVSELETQLREEQKVTQEKLRLLDGAQQKLLDAFRALSADALSNNNQSFLALAQTTLEKFNDGAKSDLEKRQQAITELVNPVKDTLIAFGSKIQELEKARVGAYSSINEQVQLLRTTQEQLRSETSNLVKALRTPTVRGRWGEIQLKRVVELAGMLDHCDFYEQASVNTEDGRLRPDLLVRLPGQKTIVVDAKAPLEAYLDALQTEDDIIRKAKLGDHAHQIRNHVASLGKKSY